MSLLRMQGQKKSSVFSAGSFGLNPFEIRAGLFTRHAHPNTLYRPYAGPAGPLWRPAKATGQDPAGVHEGALRDR